jgi:hypothetical protein
MANGGIDDWVGKTVGVRFVPEGIGETRQTQASFTLESADERGVMLSFHGEDAHNRLSKQYRFVPWHKIESIQPLPH